VQLQVQRCVPAVADPEDPFLRAGTAARSPAPSHRDSPVQQGCETPSDNMAKFHATGSAADLRRAYPRTDVKWLSVDPRQFYRLRIVDQLVARTTHRFLCAAT